VGTQQVLRTTDAADAALPAFTPDSCLLAAHNTELQYVGLWDWRAGTLARLLLLDHSVSSPYLNLEFSADGGELHTNRRTMAADVTCCFSVAPEAATAATAAASWAALKQEAMGHFLESEWITYAGHEILWIPQGDRQKRTIHRNKVALVAPKGRLAILGIDPSKLHFGNFVTVSADLPQWRALPSTYAKTGKRRVGV
jgi:hypothetical protein